MFGRDQGTRGTGVTMTDREHELRENLRNEDSTIAVTSAVSLAKDHLMPSGRYPEAESVLLDALGLQAMNSGFVIQLTLSEVYAGMKEFTRARRFLNWVGESSKEEVRREAERLLQEISEE